MNLRYTFLPALVGALSVAAVVLLAAGTARAVTVDLVPVGNPGNADDTYFDGYGGVDYVYQIGKYEVTNAQWREFLDAKAAVGDPYGLYNAGMGSTYGGIARSGSGTAGDPYEYTAKGGADAWDNRPVNFVNFWSAARFCNWLYNGQGDGDTESGAYINIGNNATFARQADATWCLPTEDEWYKAAYHKNDGVTGNYWLYPTGHNDVPSNDLINPDPGNNANFKQPDSPNSSYTIDSPYYTTVVGEFENSESPYGTFDQGGNEWEWNETAMGASNRGWRGGDWSYSDTTLKASWRYHAGSEPEYAGYYIGLRVACLVVPEPGTLALLATGLIGLLAYAWRKRK